MLSDVAISSWSVYSRAKLIPDLDLGYAMLN